MTPDPAAVSVVLPAGPGLADRLDALLAGTVRPAEVLVAGGPAPAPRPGVVHVPAPGRAAGVRRARSPVVLLLDEATAPGAGWVAAATQARETVLTGPAGTPVALPRTAYVQVGGDDEALGAGRDRDLVRRLARAGVAVRTCPDLAAPARRADRREGAALGACLARWRAERDPAAWSELAAWLRARRPGPAALAGVLQGLVAGAGLPARRPPRPVPRARRAVARLARAARHPARSADRWAGRRPAVAARLDAALDRVLAQGGDPVLALGDRAAVERAVRRAGRPVELDAAGTAGSDPAVTVVSAALGAGALPAGRWATVVVGDLGEDPAARLAAATAACRPGGTLVVRRPRRGPAVDAWQHGGAVAARHTRGRWLVASRAGA